MIKQQCWLQCFFVILMFSVPISVSAQENSENASRTLQEEKEIQLLKQKFATELVKLQKLEQYLNVRSDKYQAALKAGDKVEADAIKREYLLLKKEYDESLQRLQKLQRLYKSAEAQRRNREINTQLSDTEKNNAASILASTDDGTVGQPAKGKGVDTLIQEEHGLFNNNLTLEAGITYTHSDRKQLVLNGFLALDAIFLGNISLEGVKTDLYRYDLTARYGVTDRTNLNLNVPFIQRSTTYQKGGAGGSAAIVGEKTITRDPTLGDVNFGLSHQLLKETTTNPDVVWNLSVTAPTGVDPYGVETRSYDTSDSSVKLEVPKELPTGSGVWAASTGLSWVKTLDPAVIFANIAYTYTEPESFSDIDPAKGKQPGEVDLGNSWQYGVGLAFAFNDKLSTSITYSHSITSVSRTRPEDGEWQDIIGSTSNSATLGIGATYAIDKNLAMVTTVGAGLTTDAPDLSFSLKFPYTF